jgi:hypothetical protein
MDIILSESLSDDKVVDWQSRLQGKVLWNS